MKAIRLRTEYLIAPLGIDMQKPMLFWNAEGGKKQKGFRLTASVNGTPSFDSGIVHSSSMRFEFPLPLKSRDQVEWTIALLDENEVMGEPTSSSFEMGLLSASDWKASWITAPIRINKKKRYPVDCFLKEFEVKDIVSARLYATALGIYEIRINGRKAGNDCLAPGITDYNKRVHYQTIDVTSLLKAGNNTIEAELADGWYRGSVGAWGTRNQYGKRTKLLIQLEITKRDGTRQTIVTDETWKWSNDGPIRFADNKDGEIVDARLVPSYKGKARLAKEKIVPLASNNVPLTEHEHHKPIETILTPSKKTVLKLGKNIAGYVTFKVKAKEGERIILRFGEILDKDGEFTQKNIQVRYKDYASPLQKVEYTCKEGENSYRTKFAIFGFQYILVEGDLDPKDIELEAISVYSDLEETLSFSSSNELLNQFFECTRLSAKNNHADLPTDCPTRERHGWSGDAQIFANTAGYLFNYAPFARKYEKDLISDQLRNGDFPQIAPKGGTEFWMNCMNGSPGWSDAGILIPYRMWKLYGDKRILEESYEAMRRYVKRVSKKMGRWYPTASPTGIKGKSKKYLINFGQAYGEWAEPDEVHHMTWKDCAVPHPEVATAYASYVFSRFSQIARELGHAKEAERYAFLSQKTKEAYQALRRTEKFTLDTDRQAELVRPLYFDLLDDEQKAYAKKRLIEALEHYKYRVGTGFLSTPLILYVLEDIDLECAYRLLENEEIPGWLSMPKNGATTIWEAWEGPLTPNGGIGSLNHYSKGASCEWVITRMVGLNIESENHFSLTPRPGGNFAHAKASYQSVYGRISLSWKKEGDGYVFDISVPSNTEASFSFKGKKQELGPGEHRLTF